MRQDKGSVEMGYQALYRVWRPQRFADLVGQEMITKTLQNAIVTGQTSHAYLFTGPRGTGKTSAAKILLRHLIAMHAKMANLVISVKSARQSLLAD